MKLYLTGIGLGMITGGICYAADLSYISTALISLGVGTVIAVADRKDQK